jgi:hypothetical protein
VSGVGAPRTVTALLSLVLVVLGVAMVVRTVAAGGGPLALGVLLGLLLCGLGAGRLYLARHGG